MDNDQKERNNIGLEDLREQFDPVTATETDVLNVIDELVEEEPRTVREIQDTIGESAGLTRDQTEHRLETMASCGFMQSKKSGTGRTSPRIYWKDDE